MPARLTEKFVKSLPWAAGEALFNTLHGIATVVVIAHFIAPAELGAASTAMVTVLLVEVFSSAGLGDAVIRAKSAHTAVTDTAQCLAVGLALLGMAACAGAAIIIAQAYEDPRLIALTLAASLTLPLNAAAAVPSAILTRKIRAGALTRRMIGGKIAGFAVLCLGAAFGLGPWALVIAGLATSAGSLVMILTAVKRRPHLRFDRHEARGLMHFGALLGAENILHAVSIRAFSLLFGYFHGLVALGHFQLALRLAEEIGALLNNTVVRFGLSYFAGRERAAADAAGAFLTGTKVIAAATTPLFAGMALVAHDFIILVFGARWEAATPMLQIISLSWIVVFQRILIGLILRARGEQGVLVAFASIAASVALLSCVATGRLAPFYGVMGFACRRFVIAPLVTLTVESRLQISRKVQALNLLPAAAATGAMALAVIAFQFAVADDVLPLRLIGSIALGALVYGIAIWLMSPEIVKLSRSFLLPHTKRG